MTDLEKAPDPSTDGQGDAPNLVTWLINDVMLSVSRRISISVIVSLCPIKKWVATRNDASCILIVRVWACFVKEVILSVP